MNRLLLLAIITGVLALGSGVSSVSAKECRMEQQCKWKDFKKICVWVRVCR